MHAGRHEGAARVAARRHGCGIGCGADRYDDRRRIDIGPGAADVHALRAGLGAGERRGDRELRRAAGNADDDARGRAARGTRLRAGDENVEARRDRHIGDGEGMRRRAITFGSLSAGWNGERDSIDVAGDDSRADRARDRHLVGRDERAGGGRGDRDLRIAVTVDDEHHRRVGRRMPGGIGALNRDFVAARDERRVAAERAVGDGGSVTIDEDCRGSARAAGDVCDFSEHRGAGCGLDVGETAAGDAGEVADEEDAVDARFVAGCVARDRGECVPADGERHDSRRDQLAVDGERLHGWCRGVVGDVQRERRRGRETRTVVERHAVGEDLEERRREVGGDGHAHGARLPGCRRQRSGDDVVAFDEREVDPSERAGGIERERRAVDRQRLRRRRREDLSRDDRRSAVGQHPVRRRGEDERKCAAIAIDFDGGAGRVARAIGGHRGDAVRSELEPHVRDESAVGRGSRHGRRRAVDAH
jgi:hypothetical protein